MNFKKHEYYTVMVTKFGIEILKDFIKDVIPIQ